MRLLPAEGYQAIAGQLLRCAPFTSPPPQIGHQPPQRCLRTDAAVRDRFVPGVCCPAAIRQTAQAFFLNMLPM